MRTTKLLSLLALVVFLACNVRAFAAAPDRKTTADQFKDYVQKRFASPHQTTAVFFDTRIEAAEKRREKLRKQLSGSKAVLGTITVKDVYKDQFVFKPIGQ